MKRRRAISGYVAKKRERPDGLSGEDGKESVRVVMKQRGVLAIIFAGILSAVMIRAARSDDDLANAASASHSAPHHTATAALHTAAPAHHHLHHGALAAAHRHRRAHVTPELRAQKPTLRPVSALPPAPATPARESHPRAALPVIVRPVHHPTWESGSRLAALLPRTGTTSTLNSTTLGHDEQVRVSLTER